MRSETGDVCLYENNVLKQFWQENKQGVKSDEFIVYKNGRVAFLQPSHDILEQIDSKRIVNHIKGLRMEIWSAKTGHLIYHGEYNEKYQIEGWGIEYDEESGRVVLEGIWKNGTLIEAIRCFNEDTMTELKRNGKNSLDPVKRIPIYVGGFRYDEDTETFIREGKGCLIDKNSGIATRECEWKDGREVSGVDLYDGWFDPNTPYTFPSALKNASTPNLKVTINGSIEMNNLKLQMTNLVVSSNCCNDVNSLDLNKYKWLQSLEIGDACFESVKIFKIDGLNQLKSLKIGKNSFTQVKNSEIWDNSNVNNESKSFHILNCKLLESIEIDEYSFSDFAGQFELRNLSALQSIKIGDVGYHDSWSFLCNSFVIGGILNDILIMNN